MSKGYVYVLSNPAFPGLVKIGRSDRGGECRRSQLSNTGVPHAFNLVFEIMSLDSHRLETSVHNRLSKYRENKDREFFRLDETAAVFAVIDSWIYQSGFESDFFDQWQDHVENFYPAQPVPEPPQLTPEQLSEQQARIRESIRSLKEMLD